MNSIKCRPKKRRRVCQVLHERHYTWTEKHSLIKKIKGPETTHSNTCNSAEGWRWDVPSHQRRQRTHRNRRDIGRPPAHWKPATAQKPWRWDVPFHQWRQRRGLGDGMYFSANGDSGPVGIGGMLANHQLTGKLLAFTVLLKTAVTNHISK